MTKSTAYHSTVTSLLMGVVVSIALVLTRITITEGCPLSDESLANALSNICEKSNKLTVSYGDSPVQCGDQLRKEDTSEAPTVEYLGAKEGACYVLVMVDPDASGPPFLDPRYYLHWIVTDIKGYDLTGGGITGKGEDAMKYIGTDPPAGSGPHRYQFVLFETAKQIEPVNQRSGFSLKQFVKDNEICTVVGVFEFKVEVEN